MVGVFGVGPMGLGMTNLASFFGATVIAIDANQYRLDLAQKLGAKHAINLTQSDVAKTILELTDGKGLSLATLTAPLVPMVMAAIPGLSAILPRFAKQPSLAEMVTGVPGSR